MTGIKNIHCQKQNEWNTVIFTKQKAFCLLVILNYVISKMSSESCMIGFILELQVLNRGWHFELNFSQNRKEIEVKNCKL